MQPHRTDERQVCGVKGGGNGQDETSVIILTKQTKFISDKIKKNTTEICSTQSTNRMNKNNQR